MKRNGQVWTLKEDRCSVCSCKVRLMHAAELVMVLFALPPHLFPQPVDPWASCGSNLPDS